MFTKISKINPQSHLIFAGLPPAGLQDPLHPPRCAVIFQLRESLSDEKIQILEDTFESKENMISYIRSILGQDPDRVKPMWRLSAKEEAFMLEFFKHHHNPEKLEQQEGVYVGMSAQETQCFFLKKGDRFEEISYLKTVDNLYAK